jgi:hypothetical protein
LHFSVLFNRTYLETIYHHDNDARKFQLDLEIHEYNQGPKSIQEYYSGFMSLWLEHNSILYSKVPTEAMITVQELQEKNMRDQFLMKLSSEFEPIRRQLMARTPIPSLTECFREIMREEQTLSTRTSLEESTKLDPMNMALLTQGKATRVGRDVKCYTCQEFRHIAKSCKKKFCNYCKKEGHIITECRRRPQNKQTLMQALDVPVQQGPTSLSLSTVQPYQFSQPAGRSTPPISLPPGTTDGYTTQGALSAMSSDGTITPETVQQMIQSTLAAMG